MFTVSEEKITYVQPEEVDAGYTDRMDREYDWMAKGYDLFLTLFPVWKRWIRSVLPFVDGRDVLEVSFGNGYLMSRYASNSDIAVCGLDYNATMIDVATAKLAKRGIAADLIQGTVESMPYADATFDTVINTMALSGYPDAHKALAEMVRVLKPGGRLLLVDFDYPRDRNIFGFLFARLWERLGDVLKDIDSHLSAFPLWVDRRSIGGFGSVRLYVCTRLE